MRILHVVPTYLPAWRYGGPIQSVHGLCKALVKRGHEIDVYTTNVDGPRNSDVPIATPMPIDGVQVTYFPVKYSRFLYITPLMAACLSRQIKHYDLVHIHSIFRWPTFMASRMARKNAIPYIISPRGMLIKDLLRRKSYLLKTIWLNTIERKNLEWATAIHVTSQLEAKEMNRFRFKLCRIFTIPNGADSAISVNNEISKLSPAVRDVLKKTPFITFLGRISWKKGLERLIASLVYIPDVHLVIGGNDEDQYVPVLRKLAAQCQVADRITFAGYIDEENKAALFRKTGLLVLPSYSENFGNVVLEAMSYGCPVVVTPEVGLAETVRQFGAGFVAPGDPKILGPAIRNLLSNPALLQEMGGKGRIAFQEYFTWEQISHSMENVYREILEQRIVASHA